MMESYCASKLFQVRIKNEKKIIHGSGQIKNYHYPFNFEFEKITKALNKGEFHGSGIYLITYNEEVIYIGKYMPYGKGNVITDRWIKHIATITNRGHRVGGFGKEKIRNKKNPKYRTLENIETKDAGLKNIVRKINKSGRIKDTGCSTSVKRLAFAYKHWDTFRVKEPSEFKENVLPKFKFHYMQINGDKKDGLKVEYPSVKEKEYHENLASLLETYLLWKYNPICNSNEGLIDINQNINVDHIEKDIKSFLEKLNIMSNYTIPIST